MLWFPKVVGGIIPRCKGANHNKTAFLKANKRVGTNKRVNQNISLWQLKTTPFDPHAPKKHAQMPCQTRHRPADQKIDHIVKQVYSSEENEAEETDQQRSGIQVPTKRRTP